MRNNESYLFSLKKKTKGFIFTIFVLIVIILVLGTTNVFAGILQSNSATNTTNYKQTGEKWILDIRKMEETGQAMGLNESVDSTSLAARK